MRAFVPPTLTLQHGEEPGVTDVNVVGCAPEGLVDAVLAYEAALAEDDLSALADFFVDSEQTLRADASGLLVGHRAINSFRAGRGGVGGREVLRFQVIPAGEDSCLVVTVNAPASGGRGAVTQLWRRDHGGSHGWRIAAAHVTAPAKAIDQRVWRLVGAPLVRGATLGDLPLARAGEPGALGDLPPRVLPLAGHTVAVKDLFAVAGQRIGMGARAYLESAPVESATAPAVQALLDAGADVTGIAQTDQFAYSIAGLNPDYGTPPNPAVPGGIPGGSSSGPASAVALGHVSIGLGTDTAGSIRVPASYQGLWGLRTTHGAVSLDGVAPLAPRYDTVGWLTRDGETLRAVAGVNLEPGSRPSGVVLATSLTAAASAPALAAFQAVIDRLSAAGCLNAGTAGSTSREVSLPSAPELFAAFRVTQSAEAWRSDGEWVTAHPGALAPDVQGRFDFAASVTAEQEAAGLQQVAQFAARIDSELGDSILLIPSAAGSAPLATASAAELQTLREATLGLTAVAGFTGRPALSVPWGMTEAGPVGVCLVGPRGSDLALIDIALAWQAAMTQCGAS